jgi:hypothetical protein
MGTGSFCKRGPTSPFISFPHLFLLLSPLLAPERLQYLRNCHQEFKVAIDIQHKNLYLFIDMFNFILVDWNIDLYQLMRRLFCRLRDSLALNLFSTYEMRLEITVYFMQSNYSRVLRYLFCFFAFTAGSSLRSLQGNECHVFVLLIFH